VLIILDRNVDLVPMVSHSWTYQALINDVLDMKLNRVTVSVCYFFPSRNRIKALKSGIACSQAPESGKLQKRSYDLDSKDFFWAKNALSPFPQVAEDIDTELTKYVHALAVLEIHHKAWS
jgi:hypothetical protein